MFARMCMDCPLRASPQTADEHEEMMAAVAIVALLDLIDYPRDGIIVIERVPASGREEGTAAHRRDSLNV